MTQFIVALIVGIPLASLVGHAVVDPDSGADLPQSPIAARIDRWLYRLFVSGVVAVTTAAAWLLCV